MDEMPNTPSHVEPDVLIVWKMLMRPSIFPRRSGVDVDLLVTNSHFINDKDTIELLDEEDPVAHLGLSRGRTLLRDLPGS